MANRKFVVPIVVQAIAAVEVELPEGTLETGEAEVIPNSFHCVPVAHVPLDRLNPDLTAEQKTIIGTRLTEFATLAVLRTASASVSERIRDRGTVIETGATPPPGGPLN